MHWRCLFYVFYNLQGLRALEREAGVQVKERLAGGGVINLFRAVTQNTRSRDIFREEKKICKDRVTPSSMLHEQSDCNEKE